MLSPTLHDTLHHLHSLKLISPRLNPTLFPLNLDIWPPKTLHSSSQSLTVIQFSDFLSTAKNYLSLRPQYTRTTPFRTSLSRLLSNPPHFALFSLSETSTWPQPPELPTSTFPCWLFSFLGTLCPLSSRPRKCSCSTSWLSNLLPSSWRELRAACKRGNRSVMPWHRPNYLVLILLDFWAAFNTIMRLPILFEPWITWSYQVSWKATTCAPCRLPTGIPQGSDLGPILPLYLLMLFHTTDILMTLSPSYPLFTKTLMFLHIPKHAISSCMAAKT